MASDTFRSDPERAAQLAVYLAMHCAACGVAPSPVRISRAVVAMQKAARSAKRWELFSSNERHTEETEEKNERRLINMQDKLNAELRAMVTAQHAGQAPTISLGGDCRGHCAHLRIPGMPGDGWDDSFAIY